MRIEHFGFGIEYKENSQGVLRFFITDDAGQEFYNNFATLSDAKEEVNVYVRGSLKYPPRTFTQWVQKATGRDWEIIARTSNQKQRAQYYKQYAAYCAKNVILAEYDFVF